MKTRLINIITAVAAFSMAFVSCQDYGIDTQPEKAPQLDCDALEQYNVASIDAENVIFNISSNTPWKITVSTDADDKSWCVAAPGISSAAGLVSEVIVEMADNGNDTPREAVLTITADNVESPVTVRIVQASDAALSVSGPASTEVYGVDKETKNLKIRSNRSWTISYENEDDREWLQFDTYSKEMTEVGETDVQVTAGSNAAGVKREAVVFVRTETQECSFTVKQNGVTFEVAPSELEKISAIPPVSDETYSVPVTATMEWQVSQENIPDWIKDAVNDGNGNLTFKVGENICFHDREGVVILTSQAGNLEVPVGQKHADFLVLAGEGAAEVADFDKESVVTEHGIRMTGDQTFRIGIDEYCKRGTFTWEFAEINVSNVFSIAGNPNFSPETVAPNNRILFGFTSLTENITGPSGAVWRVNGPGWHMWNNVDGNKGEGFENMKNLETINKIRKAVLKIETNTITLTMFGEDGNKIAERIITQDFSDQAWGNAPDGYRWCLYFIAKGSSSPTASDYFILKSFKAEHAE